MNLFITGPAGRLEALIDGPTDDLRAAVVFAHPHPQHGGTMHTKVVYRAAKTLAAIGCAVLRFNFRGVGSSSGAFDDGIGEKDDLRAALDFMAERHPDLDLWAGGFSFGAWIALSTGVTDARVSTLISVGTVADRYDHASVAASTKAKFFIHGERDEIAPLEAVRRLYAHSSEPKELVVIDGADHLFDGKVGEVGDAIEDLLKDHRGTGRT